MVTLADTQALFWRYITTLAAPETQIAEVFVSHGALTAQQRLDIYATMYRVRLVDTLVETFPNTHKLLGDSLFRAVAERYIRAYPSVHFSVSHVGDAFSAYLRESPAIERYDVADLAALERARDIAFLAPPADAISVQCLSQVAPDTLPTVCLKFVPALQRFSCKHDIASLWRSLENSGEAPPAAAKPGALAVWRNRFEVHHTQLEELPAEALRAAMQGASIATVCEYFANEADPLASTFAAIGAWFADGWVHAIDFEPV